MRTENLCLRLPRAGETQTKLLFVATDSNVLAEPERCADLAQRGLAQRLAWVTELSGIYLKQKNVHK